MRFYRWSSSDEYAVLQGVNEKDAELLLPHADYSSCSPPIELETVPADKGKPLGDFPPTGLFQPRLLSVRAARALSAFISGQGTCFDAVAGNSELKLFVPSVVKDLLDLSRSTIRQSTSGYRRVVTPVFRNVEDLDSQSVFVLKGFERQEVWVSDAFVAMTRSEGLRGAAFLYSSARGTEVITT